MTFLSSLKGADKLSEDVERLREENFTLKSKMEEVGYLLKKKSLNNKFTCPSPVDI
jgi:hypothetical protein